MSLEELIIQNDIKRAVIIDDAYDMAPTSFVVLKNADRQKAIAALMQEPQDIKASLAKVLESCGLAEDEWEEGLDDDDFILELWKLAQEKKLTELSSDVLFGVFKADLEAKRAALVPLEKLLGERLKVKYDKQGTQYADLDRCEIVFLDLFLGETDAQEALDEAVARIKRLVGTLSDETRPLVFLMSTKGGVELATKANELQSKASLLGCKFRTINKDEIEQYLPKILESVLSDYPRAQLVASWVDTWSQAIAQAQVQFVAALRNLDLPDYSYLQKFRLNAEGVGLGEYMQPTLVDFLGYCIESQIGISRKAIELDALDFKQAPTMHLLPSDQIVDFAHARAFIHQNYIRQNGYFLEDVSKQLQLGDVVIKLPPKVPENFSFDLEEKLAVWVVITQACDIQQNNSDAFLLLQGEVRVRDWTSNISTKDSVNTDVFRWNEKEYSIDWAKAQVSAIKINTMGRRLKKGGGYARIARFRGIEALRLQNLFASNLTRVGLPVAFHNRIEVGIELFVKDGIEMKSVFKYEPDQKMAAVIDGRSLKVSADGNQEQVKKQTNNVRVLALSPRFCDKFRGAIEQFGLDNIPAKIRGALKSYIESTEDLKTLAEHHDVKRGVSLGENIKCDIFFDEAKPDWKGQMCFVLKKPLSTR